MTIWQEYRHYDVVFFLNTEHTESTEMVRNQIIKNNKLFLINGKHRNETFCYELCIMNYEL